MHWYCEQANILHSAIQVCMLLRIWGVACWLAALRRADGRSGRTREEVGDDGNVGDDALILHGGGCCQRHAAPHRTRQQLRQLRTPARLFLEQQQREVTYLTESNVYIGARSDYQLRLDSHGARTEAVAENINSLHDECSSCAPTIRVAMYWRYVTTQLSTEFPIRQVTFACEFRYKVRGSVVVGRAGGGEPAVQRGPAWRAAPGTAGGTGRRCSSPPRP